LGLLIAAFLVINEFPDVRADASANKRTLVVRLGPRRAARLFTALVVLTFTMLALAPLAGTPATVWFGFVGLPHALGAARRLSRHLDSTPGIIPAQGWMLASFVLMSLGTSIGLLVADAAR